MKKQFSTRLLKKSFRKLVSLLEASESKVKTKMAEDRLEQSLSVWIEEKGYCRQHSVPEVAKELGTSQELLSIFVRKKSGENFTRWRTRFRIMEACRLMTESPDSNLNAIRIAVGIPDKSNFRRHFKEICGCSPAEWRSEKKSHVRLNDR